MSELERCIEFVCGIADRAAKQKVPSPFGVAHLNDDLPAVWSRNYLFATDNLKEVDARTLVAETDRLLAPRGLRHRKIELVDPEAGARLEPGFRELGWIAQCDVIMTVHRPLDRDVDTSEVNEVSFDEIAAAWAEGWRVDSHVENEETVQQLVENKRVVTGSIDTRFFASSVGGEIASYCELYSDGRTAQVENVFTLERFRKLGLARATVSRALEEAHAGEHDLIFLLADRDDWPKLLYEKLGFDEIGRIWEFIRPPTK